MTKEKPIKYLMTQILNAKKFSLCNFNKTVCLTKHPRGIQLKKLKKYCLLRGRISDPYTGKC